MPPDFEPWAKQLRQLWLCSRVAGMDGAGASRWATVRQPHMKRGAQLWRCQQVVCLQVFVDEDTKWGRRKENGMNSGSSHGSRFY